MVKNKEKVYERVKSNMIEVIEKVIEVIDKKKATNVKTFKMIDDTWLADFIMLLTVNNKIHAKAIVEAIEVFFNSTSEPLDADQFFIPPRVSGDPSSGWVILDCNSIIIHCFTENIREIYNIEALFEKRSEVYHY